MAIREVYARFHAGTVATAVLVACLAVVVACHHDAHDITGSVDFIPADIASCGTTKAVFTSSPIAASNVLGWVPLGALNPPGHTFPTDHQYIYLTSFNTTNDTVPLFAPGNVIIVGARKVHYSSNFDDYAVDFMPCRELYADFGHVRTIAPSLLAKLGAFDQNCDTYSPQPGTTVNDCFTKPLDVHLSAGDQIGTAAGLDLSLFDSRVTPLVYANPSRWVSNLSGFDHFHVVPFSDYFTEPMRTTIRGMLGQFNGLTRRTVEPLGGSIESDVAGTAQGTWMNSAQPTYPESSHLSIVPDNVDPSQIDVAIGLSQPGITSGNYAVLPFLNGGTITPPSAIVPGSPIVCWEIGYDITSVDRRGVLLVQLVSPASLKMEARAGMTLTCDGQAPLAFTSAAFTYVR